MVGCELIWEFFDAQAGGGVALGIGIDEENAKIVGCQGGGKVDCGCCLPNTAFLVRDRDDFAQANMLAHEFCRSPRKSHVSRETVTSRRPVGGCFT